MAKSMLLSQRIKD